MRENRAPPGFSCARIGPTRHDRVASRRARASTKIINVVARDRTRAQLFSKKSARLFREYFNFTHAPCKTPWTRCGGGDAPSSGRAHSVATNSFFKARKRTPKKTSSSKPALVYFKMNACLSDIYFWLTVAHVPLARLRHDRTRLL